MNGFVNALKPPGMTSHDVVARLRRVFKTKAGHLGTLDPMARGVLPVALGSHTRLASYFLDEDKEYLAEFTFGLSTDTGDTDGSVTKRIDAGHLTVPVVLKALPSLSGHIHQVPPAYSAVKIGGRKMYEAARRGEPLQHPGRQVQVHRFTLLGWISGSSPKGVFFVRVGKGTYIRSLAVSLGDMVGTGACLSYLLRTRVGRFTLRDAHPLSSLQASNWGDVVSQAYAVMPAFPSLHVKDSLVGKVACGVPLVEGDFVDFRETSNLLPHLVYGNVKGEVRLLATVKLGRESGKFKYDKVLLSKSDVH